MYLKNKTVLITGASSGIGEACARSFAGHGAKLILAARRKSRLKAISKELKEEFGVDIKTLNIDVRAQNAVDESINSLDSEWKKIDILINNAGLSRGLDKLHEGKLRDWEEMIDTNIKGLLYVSRLVIPLMLKNGSGHVVNIGSIAGHDVYPKGNVYCSTKFAVDALTKGMRLDLNGTNIRVTTIDPGLVETEFSIVRYRGDSKKALQTYEGLTPLTPADVADAIIYAVTRKPEVTIAEILILPTAQASVHLVNRKMKD